MNLDLGPVRRALSSIYNGPEFPLVCLGAGIVLDALTNDFIWVILGVAGFIYFLFFNKRKGEGLHL